MPLATKEAQREYQRLWIARRRADWFTGKVCTKCESSERLELHHVDPKTKISHNVWSWKACRRNEELEKCIVLCSTCHGRETYSYLSKLNSKPLQHGKDWTYKCKGCRCPECKLTYSKWRRLKYLRTGN